MGLILALWVACSTPPEPSDAQVYLEAVQTSDPERCRDILAPALRGECGAMAARDRARAGQLQTAQRTCAELEPGTWRDECFFLIADAVADSPQKAREMCSQAGRFRNQCFGHAIARAISEITNAGEPGQELQTIAALDAAIAPYIPGPGRQARVESVMAGVIARRVRNDHFAADTCGQAPPIICQKAYAERMRSTVRAAQQRDGAWRQACPAPVRTQKAAELGLPTWDPALDPILQEGWTVLCQ